MKKALATLLLVSCMLSLQASCRSSKDTTSAQTSANTDVYDAVVSFISIGSGVDYKKKKNFDECILSFEQSEKLVLQKESYPWGREGEIDVCLRFTGLNKEQKKSLLKNIRQAISGSELIQLSEQAPCLHKR